MHTKQETRETIILNLLLNNDGITLEEIKNGMIFAGVLNPTNESMSNSIRATIMSLNRRFEKYSINLIEGSIKSDKTHYTTTEEAKQFCIYNLLEKLYDEEGMEIGVIFQHPISLNKERLALI